MPIATRTCLAALLLASAVPFGTSQAHGCGEESGGSCDTDADDARYLLKAAVAAVKKDEGHALAWFTEQSHGFRTEDLYVFCIGPKDIIDAHPDPKINGTDAHQLIDPSGFHFGDTMIKEARAGTVTDITYLWPRLGETKPYLKHTMYERVSDQICAVGYYE